MNKLGIVSAIGTVALLRLVSLVGTVRADPATADLPDTVGRILVLDITTHTAVGGKQNRVFCFPGDYRLDKSDLAAIARDKNKDATNALIDAVDATGHGNPVPDGSIWGYLRNKKLSHRERLALVSDLAAKSSSRWRSSKGSMLGIFVFTDSVAQANVNVDEVARMTRLASDLVTLVKLAAKGTFGVTLDRKRPPDINLYTYSWALQLVRGNVTITATAAPTDSAQALARVSADSAKAASAAAATAAANASTAKVDAQNSRDAVASAPRSLVSKAEAKAAADAETAARSAAESATAAKNNFAAALSAAASAALAQGGNQAQTTLITGPGEHMFLSVNLPVSSVTQITLGDSGVAAPSEKPKKFLIGLNIMLFGDLLSDQGYGFGGLTVGGFCEASGRPGNSLGFDVGWRFASGEIAGYELDTFSPFLGWERTVSESKKTGGGNKTKYVFKPVVGVSFNLDKALDWVGSGNKSK